MKNAYVFLIIERLREATRGMPPTASDAIVAEYGRDPYLILISCLLSLRAKDSMSFPVSCQLFKHVRTPQQMVALSQVQIEKIIYSVGFYRQKAKQLREVSQTLIDNFGGEVPNTLEELLSLPGVGRKTANLVITLGYGKPGICVDTHVHRISNRLGYVETKTPEQTEMALRKKLPPQWWIPINDILVAFGQALCKPISPWCSTCAVETLCEKRGVDRHR